MKWLGVMACVALVACGEASVGGEVTLRMADGPVAVVGPTDCAERGSAQGAGVELWDEAGWVLRFVHDSRSGPSVQLSTPEGEEAMVGPRECEVFSGELRQRTAPDDPRQQVTYGHLDLECHTAAVQVVGALDFDACATMPPDPASR